MIPIYCLTDYKGIFGSKFDAVPYRSGFDKELIKVLFEKEGYTAVFLKASEVSFSGIDWKGKIVLYSSSEEYKLLYKSFIEDIVYGLHLAGAILFPQPGFLRANNNKVFMEVLSQTVLPATLQTLPGHCFGTFHELEQAVGKGLISFPCVFKMAAGAKSRGVFKASHAQELLKKAKKSSSSFILPVQLKEWIRTKIHKGYGHESAYQNKFIIQPFVPELKNDWKILIYGEKYFILKRSVRVNDFRASGSGIDYRSGSKAEFPSEMFPFVRDYYRALEVPNLSIDFGYDGSKGYVFEYQAIHYGTYTQQKSKDYYEYINGNWEIKENNLSVEEVYVHSIVEFMKRKNVAGA
ncbi:MAG: hypothetical protein IPM71_08855 [Bacteroidota bacterium]|nr:MAG: hypothetical protein IPM71_08855 [Bacteroidota bacterium]